MLKCPVFMLGLSIVASFTHQAHSSTVLINGTFDNNTTGWSGTYESQESLTGGLFPAIDTGNYFFAGNQSFTTTIRQTYTLTANEISAANAGTLEFLLSADLFGFTDQDDYSEFQADFRAGNNRVLDSRSLSSVDGDPGVWGFDLIAGDAPSFQSVSGLVAAGTENIRFSVSSTRRNGQSSDGYVDNAFLSLTNLVVVPLPTTGLLLLGSLAALGLRKTRKRG